MEAAVPELAAVEQADEREVAEGAAQVGNVVVLDAEQGAAAPGGGEVEAGARAAALEAARQVLGGAAQVGARGPGVAHGEAEAAALGDGAGGREQAALGVEL